jgi:thymidylate kinase
VLIEGIAGSGKTSAVAKTIVNLLRTSDKGQELLNNVWFVHATED